LSLVASRAASQITAQGKTADKDQTEMQKAGRVWSPETAGRPAQDALHVWFVPLVAVDPVAAQAVLDSRETDGAARFVHGVHRRRYVARHAAARSILGWCLAAGPREVVYAFACAVCGSPEHGKPLVRDAACPVRFSMSSSADGAIVAVSFDGDVGTDIEALDRRVDHHALIGHYAPAERRALALLDEVERPRAILESWTRKEAYAKVLGLGLFLEFDDFEVTMPPRPPAVLRAAPAQRGDCGMAAVALPAPYVATVAWSGRGRDIELWEWRDPAFTGRAPDGDAVRGSSAPAPAPAPGPAEPPQD
jgi:4'-phosphopantetheinyl transferase